MVHAYRQDRLGSVLLNMAHAWRFADRLGLPLLCHWPSVYPKRPDMAFRDIYVDESRPDFAFVDDWFNPARTPCLDLRQVRDLEKIDPSQDIYFSWTGPPVLSGDTRQAAMSRARQLLWTLPWNPQVQIAFDSIKEQVDLGSYVSVHLRRADEIVPTINENRIPAERMERFLEAYAIRYADVPSYCTALDEAASGAPLFLFSDSETDIRALAASMPHRDILSMANFPDVVEPLAPVQRDFLEQLIMAHTRMIVGPISNYSMFAQLLGDLTITSVHNWLDPSTLIPALERQLSGVSASSLSGVFEAYARMMQKYGREGPAEDFLRRARELS